MSPSTRIPLSKYRVDPDQMPVILSGARTPFVESGGAFGAFMSYELGARALGGLLTRTALDRSAVDLVVMGTVVHEVHTSNVAREAMLAAGMPSTTPACTVSMAGLSPLAALTGLSDMITTGRIDIGIAGGTETFSDMPVRLSRGLRRGLFTLYQGRTAANLMKVLRKLRLRDLALDLPSPADFTTRRTMGELCEAMAAKFGVGRDESDLYAAASHRKAIDAWQQGRYEADIVPVESPDGVGTVTRDDSPRADATPERLAQLTPAFDRRSGVITAGNASRFTDGAAALLVSSLAKARDLQLEPQAVIRDYVYGGVADLATESLCGPAMTIPLLLQRNGLSVEDVGVWELHEAFAAQILVNQACLASDDFVQNRLGLQRAPGAIPPGQLNLWGGSLALGNPFSATGDRLVMTAARRLHHSAERYAIVSSCAGGGLGGAVLLENADRL